MTLSRLLSPSLRSRINIVECRRWYCLVNDKGEISQPLKKSEMAEQQKAVAVDLFEKKYITEDEGVFPKETHAQKEVGAWNNLVTILQRTKKKFLGDHMEQKSCRMHALTSTSDLNDSGTVASAGSIDSGNMTSLNITIQSEMTSVANKEESVVSETTHPSYADKSESLEVVKIKNSSNSSGPEELLNVSSKACEVSADDGVSSICKSANSKDGVQLVNVYRPVELVGKEREAVLAGEILSKSEEACVLRHQTQDEIPRASHGVSANECNSTAPENQQENIMEACKFTPNLKFVADTSDTSCGSGRVASLVDVSQENRNDEPDSEAKNDQLQCGEVVSEILSVFEKDGKPNFEQGAHSNSLLWSEATNKWRDVLEEKSVVSADKNRPAEDTSKLTLSKSKEDEISSVSNNSFQALRLEDLCMEADHQSVDQNVNSKSEKSAHGEFEHLNGTSQNTFVKIGDIKSLMECIRELPPVEPSFVRPEETVGRSVDRNREGGASSGIRVQTDTQSFDRKKRTSSQGVVGKKENSRLSNIVLEDLNTGDERTETGDIETHDCSKSIETKEAASLRGKNGLNKGKNAPLSEKLSDGHKVTIKFVTLKATESDLSTAFKDCGAITKVVFESIKSTKFKVGHIYFESEEGRQKALRKSDLIVRDKVVLQATCPPKGRKRMCIPDLIGYPEVPSALVKHPSRTAMIKDLKHNVSFHDIEVALAFCRSKITGIFFGSSSSVAYVEFETVEDKEIAIEKQYVFVLGDRLPILRIDAPRTTVIRISNIKSLPMSKVVSVCNPLGKANYFFMRNSDIVDVYFKFTEWPRMLKILNRLNGVEVDGQHLVAKPAPVYPPDVLHVLWSQPKGRRHLKTAFKSMLLKLGENGLATVGITEIVDNLYADAQET